ncbi:8021_t:CDS:2 [Rhizophagus irregularis]|nr:8021_t:CDS:2 [Rhizophagus irregularis]
MEPPPLHIPDNNEYPESINNIYSNEFSQPEEQRIIGNEQQLQPIPDISTDTTVNYTELFKIEISGGVEIVNRMHPYQMPIEHNSCPRTYADLTPQINQQGNISDINQNYVNQ